MLFYYSLKYTTAGNSSLIIATDSLMTVLLAVAFLKERMTRRKALGIALGFAGVLWIVSDGALPALRARGPTLGDLLAFGAALAWAAYSVLSKPVAHLYASLDLSWITWAVGALLISPSLLADGAVSSLASASLLGWACVSYMALAATGLGYFVYLKGIKEIGAAATARYIFLAPVYVLVLAFLFLGEPVPLHTVLAAAVILGGIWLAEEAPGEAGSA